MSLEAGGSTSMSRSPGRKRAVSLFASTAAAALVWSAGGQALAQDASLERIEALEAQIAALQEQVADLKPSTAANIQAVRADQQATTVSIANGRPTIASGDGKFTASIRGVTQLDTAEYFQDD